jgi:hypothetical protein
MSEDHPQAIGSIEAARQAVERFVQRFGPPYRLLAYHAALPLVLTPELLNYLRSQFLRGQVPWVAEADLLLSDLCHPVGYEQFAMDAAVRSHLVEEMRRELGVGRMEDVARLLIEYVGHLERTDPLLGEEELRRQQWSAMVYLDDRRDDVARSIAESFRSYLSLASSGEAIEDRPAVRSRLASLAQLTQTLAPEISRYPELVGYAERIGQLLTDLEGAENGAFGWATAGPESTEVLGVALPSIQNLLPPQSRPDPTSSAGKSKGQVKPPVDESTRPLKPSNPLYGSDFTMVKPIELFYSYSHQDEKLRDQLENHLAILKRQGVIFGWHDRKIGVGREWEGEIDRKLKSSQVILLLISPNFS